MIDELKRNGSGYYDPTAYKAMQNYEREEEKMKQGEIWEVGYGFNVKYAVVVAVQEDFCNVLVLNEENKSDDDVQVKAFGIMYTHPAMLSYTFNDRFNRFIRAMTEEEFNSLLSAISKKLLFAGQKKNTEEVERLKTKLAETEATLERKKEVNKKLCEANEILKEQVEELEDSGKDSADVIRLATERDLYKAQYEKLLERLIGA